MFKNGDVGKLEKKSKKGSHKPRNILEFSTRLTWEGGNLQRIGNSDCLQYLLLLSGHPSKIEPTHRCLIPVIW